MFDPELVAYAASLGIRLVDPREEVDEQEEAHVARKRRATDRTQRVARQTPSGRPRKPCPHPPEMRRVKRNGKSYCRPCETERERARYWRLKEQRSLEEQRGAAER